MHPPHAAEIFLNSAKIQRRAAPMPRVVDIVSDIVCRVPNPTRVRMSRSIRSADEAATMSWMRGSSADGSGVDGAAA